MGLFPVRGGHSEIGLAPQTPQDSTNRIPSERAAATSSGGKAAPAMSSRYCCALLPASRPSAHADRAGLPGSSPASAPQSATSVLPPSSISTSAPGSTLSAASAASLRSSGSLGGGSSERS
eukprot:15444093-Alexandrium_andersonii.AAC.1